MYYVFIYLIQNASLKLQHSSRFLGQSETVVLLVSDNGQSCFLAC